MIELFVGIRLKPFLYGFPVNGYILENDGKGNFSNVTPQIAPELQNTGMIKDMLWADVDGDNDKDMIERYFKRRLNPNRDEENK